MLFSWLPVAIFECFSSFELVLLILMLLPVWKNVTRLMYENHFQD